MRAALAETTVTRGNVWAATGVVAVSSATVGSARPDPGKAARHTVNAMAVRTHAEDLGIMMAPVLLAVVSEGGALGPR